MKKKRIYNLFQLISAVVMILSMAWLTVNTPFTMVTPPGLSMQTPVSKSKIPASGNEDNSPLNNTTEEKVPSNNNFSEEYLHHTHTTEPIITEGFKYHKLKNSGTYTAFHGELLVPPPNSL